MIKPVYKFMSGEKHHLKGLREGTVWFSSTKDLNDPYEGRINLEQSKVSLLDRKTALINVYNEDNNDIKKSRKEVDKFLRQLGEQRFNEHVDRNTQYHFDRFLKIHHETRHVLSLSKASEPLEQNIIPEPLSLMVMWGHYANGFRGMCVEYDYDQLCKSINKLNKISVSAREVEYVEGNLPTVQSKTILNDIIYKNGDVSREILKAYCTKHKAWSHENEVRIISELHGENKHSKESITRIFVSDQNQTLVDEVISILKTKHYKPKLILVSLHKFEFGFYFKQKDY